MQKAGDITVSRRCIPALHYFGIVFALKRSGALLEPPQAVPFAHFGGAAPEDLLPRDGMSTAQTQLRESANCKVGCQQSAFC